MEILVILAVGLIFFSNKGRSLIIEMFSNLFFDIIRLSRALYSHKEALGSLVVILGMCVAGLFAYEEYQSKHEFDGLIPASQFVPDEIPLDKFVPDQAALPKGYTLDKPSATPTWENTMSLAEADRLQKWRTKK